jgi:hypothetical protein
MNHNAPERQDWHFMDGDKREEMRRRGDTATYAVECVSDEVGRIELVRANKAIGPFEAIHCAIAALCHFELDHGDVTITFRAQIYNGEPVEFSVEGFG